VNVKNLKIGGCAVVVALVVGYQWYVQANPIPQDEPVMSQREEVIDKLSHLSTTLPVKQVRKIETNEKNWHYHFEHDDLRQTTTEFGNNSSLNKHVFSFPYNKGAWLNIATTSKPIKDVKAYKPRSSINRVFLTTTDGQFLCEYDGCYASVSFDGGKVERFRVSTLVGSANNIMEVIDGQRFMREVKRHKSAIIEVDYFQNGSQQFRFNLNDGVKIMYSS